MAKTHHLSTAWLNKINSPPESKKENYTENSSNSGNVPALRSLASRVGAMGPEYKQILLRQKLDKLISSQTVEQNTCYLNGLQALIKDLGNSQKQALILLHDLRENYKERQNQYRMEPFFKAFPHTLNVVDEHTLVFMQQIIDKHIMYPASHTEIMREILKEELQEMSRVDKLAAMILKLTDSMYSVLILRRLYIDYGITTTAKTVTPTEEKHCDEGSGKRKKGKGSNGKSGKRTTTNRNTNSNTNFNNNAKRKCALDDAALENILTSKDPYSELANEAILCANYIENGIEKQSDTLSIDQLAEMPGEYWKMFAPTNDDDFYHDHIEMMDTDSNSTKYSKSRNFLVETGLTGSDGDIGDIVYLKELLCNTLADVKVRRYGKYHSNKKHKGHFYSYLFNDIADDRERIPKPKIDQRMASFFGERVPCPHPNCNGKTKSKSDGNFHCQREWYYRTGVGSVSIPKKRDKYGKVNIPEMDSATRHKERLICEACIKKQNIDLKKETDYVQSGYHIASTLSKTVQLMKNIVDGRIVRTCDQNHLTLKSVDDGKEIDVGNSKETKSTTKLNANDGGLIFAMIRAKNAWRRLIADKAHPDEITIAEANYKKLAKEVSEEANSEFYAKEKAKKIAGSIDQNFFGNRNNLVKKIKYRARKGSNKQSFGSGSGSGSGSHPRRLSEDGMDYFHESFKTNGFREFMVILNSIKSEQEDHLNAYRGELLLSKLNELRGKELTLAAIIKHSNKPHKFDLDGTKFSEIGSDSEYDSSNDDDDDGIILPSNLQTKSDSPIKLKSSIDPLEVEELGLNMALHTENGQKLLSQSFSLLESKMIDHFGKNFTRLTWCEEMTRVLEENGVKINKFTVKPRNSTVMWKLRDGFERFEEYCYIGNSNSKKAFPHNITRRSFNMYFGHVFTMSDKKDWNASLHIDYLELMVETLFKTRYVVALFLMIFFFLGFFLIFFFDFILP
jgi:hypothetical protein